MYLNRFQTYLKMVLITNYRNLRERDDLLERQNQQFQLIQELNEIKERANIRRWADLPVEIERPRGPETPKDREDKYDIRERLITKLKPYFLNTKELVSFTERLEDINQLDTLDDEFNKFKTDFIGSSRKLTSDRAFDLYESFIGQKKFFRDAPKLISSIREMRGDTLKESKVEPAKLSKETEMTLGVGKDIKEVEDEEVKNEEVENEEVENEEMQISRKEDIVKIEADSNWKPLTKDQVRAAANFSGYNLPKKLGKKQMLEALMEQGFIGYDKDKNRFITKEEYNEIFGRGMGRRNRCWMGYEPVIGMRPFSRGSCKKIINGSGLVQGMGWDNMNNIPEYRQDELLRRMFMTGWN